MSSCVTLLLLLSVHMIQSMRMPAAFIRFGRHPIGRSLRRATAEVSNPADDTKKTKAAIQFIPRRTLEDMMSCHSELVNPDCICITPGPEKWSFILVESKEDDKVKAGLMAGKISFDYDEDADPAERAGHSIHIWSWCQNGKVESVFDLAADANSLSFVFDHQQIKIMEGANKAIPVRLPSTVLTYWVAFNRKIKTANKVSLSQWSSA